MLCKVKIHWNSNITPKCDYTEEFSFGFISIIAALNVILMKNNSLVHANTFGQGTCSFFATEQTWRQKANARRPPPWILIFNGKRVDQEPRWMQRTTYDPPQEQPAKTSWMWQKSLIQQAASKNTVNKSEKKRMTNRICHVSWVILQGNDIRITHVALLCQIPSLDRCF